MVCANDKYTYSNVYMLSISLPHCFYKVNTFFDVIVLDFSKPMTSYYVTPHVTTVTHFFYLFFKSTIYYMEHEGRL